MQTALFWHAADAGRIVCELCPHHCRLADEKRGICGVRLAQAGKLLAAGYGLISSAHHDPIEKKPLYHFHPGAQIFSIGGWGCNFKCKFCQNWTISQQVDPGHSLLQPDKIIAIAKTEKSIGIAYTYNEPLINIEFVAECARRAREAGLMNVLVTNGYIEKKPTEFILPLIDALNIDIKSMDEEFYKKQCAGLLGPVLNFSQQAVSAGCHVEITNLIIPGLNDTDEQITHLAEWVRANLGEKTPLHLSAYHPEFEMARPPTPPETLERAYRLCREKLAYIYLGNLFSDSGQNTLCSQCGNELIIRRGYSIRLVGLKNKNCAKCGRPADVVMG
ncbi:MAG: AmmeMemoRadiSam system radical SAM enzyme [Kiritimatiellia bacterium]|nr:AmmeMemoRadiSam system radical SAM enzyme [Kiritimatiellia bacterium]